MKTHLTLEEIEALRKAHSPQCTLGKVPARFVIGLCPKSKTFALWESPQTTHFLTSTPDPEILLYLLWAENHSPGFLRRLLDPNAQAPDLTPPGPESETFEPFSIDGALDDILDSINL